MTTSMRLMSDVAAGHAARGEGAIFFASEEETSAWEAPAPKAILKKLDEGEFAMYDTLWNSYEDDSVLPFVAKFEGVVEVDDGSGEACKYLRMTNLLQEFRRPKVMDVKLGVRTFLESECDSRKPRPDLFLRMLKYYPLQVTEEERASQSITKLRWMRLRDASSTIRSLGFRIDGVAGYRRCERGELTLHLAGLRQRSEARDEFCKFAKAASNDDGREPNGVSALDLAERMFEQLQLIHRAFETSEFVRRHECIGSSLLLVADAYGKAGVFWIDFGKTKPLPPGLEATHRSPWEPGNHEDGVLSGLDSMVVVWGDVVDLLRRDKAARAFRTGSKHRSNSAHFEAWPRPIDTALANETPPPSVIKRPEMKLQRSLTSPHHGREVDPALVAAHGSEPLAEAMSGARRVLHRLADGLCSFCGGRRPKGRYC